MIDENPVMLELNRLMPATSDLSQRRQGDLEVACYAWEQRFAPQDGSGFGFRHALAYIAGVSQKKWEVAEGLKFIERNRGTPAFSDFMRAAVAVQIAADKLRMEQEARQQRRRGPVVEDVARSTRDLESKNPNLTKSLRKNPRRLRLVK